MSGADELFAARCEGPVLDIGCGPGRFVEALASRGIPVLGVDISRSAVDQTSRRGVCALFRDINDRLPGEGRWGTVLLVDGNIGIGGDGSWCAAGPSLSWRSAPTTTPTS